MGALAHRVPHAPAFANAENSKGSWACHVSIFPLGIESDVAVSGFAPRFTQPDGYRIAA
jgi:hypothetical protein